MLGRILRQVILDIVGDASVVVYQVGVETGAGELHVTVINIHAREDVLGILRTVTKVEDRQQGVFPIVVVGPVVEIQAAAVKRVALVTFKGELDSALVQYVLQGQFDVVRKSGPVTNVIEQLLGGGGIALSALDASLAVVQEDFGIADVAPRVGGINESLVRIQELPDSEASVPEIGVVGRGTGADPVECRYGRLVSAKVLDSELHRLAIGARILIGVRFDLVEIVFSFRGPHGSLSHDEDITELSTRIKYPSLETGLMVVLTK